MHTKATTHKTPKISHKKRVHTKQHAAFATFKKVGKVQATVLTPEQIAQDKVKAKETKDKTSPKKVPTLNDLMRHLYKKIHPDLMMAYPAQKDVNEKSLSVLQAFLGSLKDNNGNEKYPVLRNASLPFYLRTSTPGHFQHVELLLHSEATLNKKVIEQQMCSFFKTIGVGSVFKWDDEYFPMKGRPDFRKNEDEMKAQQENYDNYQRESPVNETYEEFMTRMKVEAEKGKNSV